MGCVVVKPIIDKKSKKIPRQLYITVSAVPKLSCKYQFFLRKDLCTIFEVSESMESSNIYCLNEVQKPERMPIQYK